MDNSLCGDIKAGRINPAIRKVLSDIYCEEYIIKKRGDYVFFINRKDICKYLYNTHLREFTIGVDKFTEREFVNVLRETKDKINDYCNLFTTYYINEIYISGLDVMDEARYLCTQTINDFMNGYNGD